MRQFTPRSYQQLGIQFMLQNPRCALFAQPGLGKTVMATTVIDMLRAFGEIDRTLAVMPTRVLETEGWQRELAKWTHLQDLDIEVIRGTPQQRREQLRSPKPIHIVNYEILPWLLDELARAWPYDMVILDESTKVKGHDSVWAHGKPSSEEHIAYGSKLFLPSGESGILRPESTITTLAGNTRVRTPKESDGSRLIKFKATPGLKHVATQTRNWVHLTGTPMPNGAKDLFTPTYLLDQGKRLGHNVTAFRAEYQHPHPYVKFAYVDQEDSLPRVIDKIKDICLTIKAADYLDLPELVTNRINVRITDGMMLGYRHLEDQFFIALEEEFSGQIVEAANSAVLGNKLRQFTQGFLFADKKGAWQEMHQAKLDAIKELSEEVNAPMLIAYHYAPDKERLLKAFKGSAAAFDGTKQQIADFGKGKIQHLILHPGSAGHGVEGLQDGSDRIVFFGTDWSLENHDQVIERVGPTRQLQSGHPRPVFVDYITAVNTIDEMVLERLTTKKTQQEILMNALKKWKMK